jgi:hypothetical protein
MDAVGHGPYNQQLLNITLWIDAPGEVVSRRNIRLFGEIRGRLIITTLEKTGRVL